MYLASRKGRHSCSGGAAVGGHVQLLDDRQLGRERATGLAQGLAVHAHLALEHLELGVRVDDPGVAQARRAHHRGIVVGREPHRRVGPLHRAQHHARAGEVEEAPVMRHLIPRPQPLDDLQALHQAPHPLLGRDPERLVLLLAIAQPHAEDEAPLGDDVERGHLLGHVHRIEQRQQDHGGAHPHGPRLGGEPGERGQALHLLERRREEVLAHHDEVEAGVAGGPDLLDVLPETIDHRHARRVLLRHDQSEVHALSSTTMGLRRDRTGSGRWGQASPEV